MGVALVIYVFTFPAINQYFHGKMALLMFAMVMVMVAKDPDFVKYIYPVWSIVVMFEHWMFRLHNVS